MIYQASCKNKNQDVTTMSSSSITIIKRRTKSQKMKENNIQN